MYSPPFQEFGEKLPLWHSCLRFFPNVTLPPRHQQVFLEESLQEQGSQELTQSDWADVLSRWNSGVTPSGEHELCCNRIKRGASMKRLHESWRGGRKEGGGKEGGGGEVGGGGEGEGGGVVGGGGERGGGIRMNHGAVAWEALHFVTCQHEPPADGEQKDPRRSLLTKILLDKEDHLNGEGGAMAGVSMELFPRGADVDLLSQQMSERALDLQGSGQLVPTSTGIQLGVQWNAQMMPNGSSFGGGNAAQMMTSLQDGLIEEFLDLMVADML